MASETDAYWRSPVLGQRKELRLPQATLRYYDRGTGPTIVFIHGALVNANQWRKVFPSLTRDFRCVALELPLGAQIDPMPPDADLSPPALANLIADAIEALGLEEVTLVGNDNGGALCQLVVTSRPERIGRLVLLSCDAFDNMPPKAFRPLMPVYRRAAAVRIFFAPARLKAVRHRLTTAIRATKRPVEPEVADSYVLPPLVNADIRRDGAKLARGIHKRYTLEAAERLRSFEKPTLIAWSAEDKFFPPEHGEQLAELIPGARLEWIEDSYSFASEDNPDRLAALIAAFVREPETAPA